VVRDITGSFDATLLLLPVVGVVMIALAALAPELSREGMALKNLERVEVSS
jgi:hypothetical protein